jgi:hypothetical protein
MDIHDFIHDALEHAASRYDPVKAKEYYERTKELKGRRSGSGLKSDRQKIGFAYTKNLVETERADALAKNREAKAQAIAQLRASAEKRRDALREKFRSIMEKVTAKGSAERERISKEVQAEIDRVPEVPKGLSKAVTERLQEKRREKIAAIRGEGRADRVSLSDRASKYRSTVRASTTQDREKIKTQLRASVDKARSNYQAAKEQIKAKYEAEIDVEYEAIRQNVR